MNTQSQSSNRSASGMTLVEMLFAVAIGMVVMAAIATLMVFTTRSFIALGNYNDLDQASRIALDRMSREIRQATNVSLFPVGNTQIRFNSNTVAYIWYSSGTYAQKLVRYEKQGGFWQPPRVILDQCDYLRFGISQRSPSNNFNFYATTDLTTAKLVDVSWTCSRQILQKKVNTESVQTAKIVMRN